MVELLHLFHSFMGNPVVTFFLAGFGTWIIFIIVASIITVNSGKWIDRQLENDQQ